MQQQLYGVCATVSLRVMPSFSDVTDVSTVGHIFKIDRCRTLLFHVAHYGDDIIGRELNLDENCPVGSGVETTTFRTAATDDDKDYRSGQQGLYNVKQSNEAYITLNNPHAWNNNIPEQIYH